MTSRTAEIVALGVIAVLIAIGGKLVLANLSLHRLPAAAVFVLLIAGCGLALRRTFRTVSDDSRVVVTKYVAYLVAAVLALWDVLAPAKWLPGSCIAAVEVAVIFDMITIWSRQRPAGA